MIEVKRRLSQKLYWLRKKQGIEIADLAKETGISPSSLSTYETGEVEPRLNALVELANYYEVSLDYLVGRQRVMPVNPKAYWTNDEIPDDLATYNQAIKENKTVPPYAPIMGYVISKYAKGYLIPIYQIGDLVPVIAKEEADT